MDRLMFARACFSVGFLACWFAASSSPASAESSLSMANILDGYSTLDGTSVEPPWSDSGVVSGSRVGGECTDFNPPCTGTCSPRPTCRFRVGAGYEIGWLQPRFTDNVSVVVTRPSGNQAYAFSHLTESTPLVWIGIENANCLGLRVRYWSLSTDAPKQVARAQVGATPLTFTIEGAGGQFTRTAVANVGDAMTSTHHLEMRTFDLEVTQRIRYGRFDTLAAFGLRYAKTHQRAHAVATAGGGGLTELACQDIRFDGFGPTAGLSVTRCLFGFNPLLRRISFWADGRGSILFGQQQQEIVLVTGGGATLAEDLYVHEDLLPMAELSGGLQLQSQPFGFGLWTLRTGYRAESWFGVGGPVDTDSNVGLHGMIFSIAATW